MSKYFKPYEGSRPFLFVSYARKQSDAVLETIRIFNDRHIRLWYDEGIPAGTDWPANIAQHMQSCERVLFFLSERALQSPNCYSEMRTAHRLGKPILLIRLDETPLDERWTEILDTDLEIPLLPAAQDRASAILRSKFIRPRFYRHWWELIPWKALGLVFSLLLFLGAASALGLLISGTWTIIEPPAPTPIVTPSPPTPIPTPQPIYDFGEAQKGFAVSFPDWLQENAIRARLGVSKTEDIYRWQLAEIDTLYFCGNLSMKNPDGIRFSPDGVCRANGSPVITGPISDLTLIKSMARLEELALVCQPLNSLNNISGLQFLRELNLAGSSIDSLSALTDLPSLEVLHLEHTNVKDLTPLEALPRLRTVTVSREMLPLTWNDKASFAVVLVRESEANEVEAS